VISNLPDLYWRFESFNRLFVGFSGGLDSMVLLHALAATSLRSRIIAVHINHGISPNADEWQRHCADFCTKNQIAFMAQSIRIDGESNLEERARTARYEVFSSLLNENDAFLTAHHRDDQVETFLLQLLRGAGIDGLAAMPEISALGGGSLIRPFLSVSRTQIHEYALKHPLSWINDESNEDIHYGRNYLRHQVIPLLLQKWPGASETISRAAEHCQQAQINLTALAERDCPALSQAVTTLSIEHLDGLSDDRIINVIRYWLRKNKVSLPAASNLRRLPDEVLRAKSDAMPLLGWGNVAIRRYRNHLFLSHQDEWQEPSSMIWSDFPLPLSINDSLQLFALPFIRSLCLKY